jgi:hypothetical protein
MATSKATTTRQHAWHGDAPKRPIPAERQVKDLETIQNHKSIDTV